MKTRDLKLKALSILLVIVMVLGMMPMSSFTAFAADTLTESDTIEVAENVTDPTVENAEPTTEPAKEIDEPSTETTEPSTEETEPAPVCDCGTDDVAIHATTCTVYAAPENPECFCVEKCTEPNLWCDVCGFDVTACEGGEDEAVVYASVTRLTFGDATIVSDGTVQTNSGTGWNYDSETNTLYITDDVTISTGDGSALESEGGGLNIHIASGKTLSLTGNKQTVVLNGNSTISGGGSMTVTGGLGSTQTVYVTGSLDISNITLTAASTGSRGNSGFALQSIGQMTFANVNATITGQVYAGLNSYCSLSISGSSVISIYSSGDVDGALSASELSLSDTSHLKVWTDSGRFLISGQNCIPIPVNGGYYRTSSDGEFTVGSDPVTLNVNDRYFEYIGAGHVGEAKQNNDGMTHTKSCTCSLAAVVESGTCEGGEATCTEQAKCKHCGASYGETNPNVHAGTEITYTDNGDGTHSGIYACCNAEYVTNEAHSYGDDNTCVCGAVLEIISVNITWSEMSFTYTDGEWNPETHTYGDGEWTPDNENGNVITVTNNGNVAVNVTFTYTKTVTEVAGSFTDESGSAIPSPFTLATGEEKKIKLILNGKPSSTFEDTKLGTVTVKITLPEG